MKRLLFFTSILGFLAIIYFCILDADKIAEFLKITICNPKANIVVWIVDVVIFGIYIIVKLFHQNQFDWGKILLSALDVGAVLFTIRFLLSDILYFFIEKELSIINAFTAEGAEVFCFIIALIALTKHSIKSLTPIIKDIYNRGRDVVSVG